MDGLPTLKYLFACVIVLSQLISCEKSNNELLGRMKKSFNDQLSQNVLMKEDTEDYNKNIARNQDHNLRRCPAFNNPQNGYVIGTDMAIGSTIRIRCEEGFWLQGPAVRMCRLYGKEAKWTPDTEVFCIDARQHFNEDSPSSTSKEYEDLQESPGQNKDQQQNNDDDKAPPFIPPYYQKWISSSQLDQPNNSEDETGSERWWQELKDSFPPFCLHKPEKGSCGGINRRYFFDSDKMECTIFYYSGCEGNQNNFEDMETCNSVCKSSIVIEDRDGGY